VNVVVRRLLALALLAAGLVLVATPRSGAAPDDCVKGTTESIESADAVFLGVVTDVARTGRGRNAEFTNTVEVERVYKGPINQVTVPVRTLAGTRQRPGLGALDRGATYLFFVRIRAEVVSAGGCSGTRPATEEQVAKVVELRGAGRPAVPPPPLEATFDRVADSDPVDFTRTAAPGLALVLVGLLGLVVVRRLGRRQA
jgi:hypothetical protein